MTSRTTIRTRKTQGAVDEVRRLSRNRWARGDHDRVSPGPGASRFEVLIAPTCSGLNPADVLQREGKHPAPAGSPGDVPGLEVAGTIVAIGDGVSTFAVGDRAFGLVGGGGHASLVVAHEREMARVPESGRITSPPSLGHTGNERCVASAGGAMIASHPSYQTDPRVDAYIDALPEWQQAICRRLRDLIHAADPEPIETIKRTVQPYFVLEGNVCALLAAKDHVNLFLYDGGIVPDPERIITAGHENKTARMIAFYRGDSDQRARP